MHVRVFVITEAKREDLIEKEEGKYEVYVREPAQKNVANRRVLEIMAQEYGVEPSEVSILTGHKGPNKLLIINK